MPCDDLVGEGSVLALAAVAHAGVVDDDGRTEGGQRLGGGAPDAASGAGDDGHAAVEARAHAPSPALDPPVPAAYEWFAMKASTRSQASAEAVWFSSAVRSKKECGAPW